MAMRKIEIDCDDAVGGRGEVVCGDEPGVADRSKAFGVALARACDDCGVEIAVEDAAEAIGGFALKLNGGLEGIDGDRQGQGN